MNIFNILIGLGLLFMIIGIYYTLFWSNKEKPNKNTEIENFKSVNDSTLPTIKGLSYKESNVKQKTKQVIVEKIEVELVEKKEKENIVNSETVVISNTKAEEQLEMDFENNNHDQDDKNIYGFSIDNFKDFEEEIDSNYPIDPEEHLENIKRNENLQNIDSNELSNEIFGDELTENNKENTSFDDKKNEESLDDEINFNEIDNI